MKIYLLDAHNIIYKSPSLTEKAMKSLDIARRSLVFAVQDYADKYTSSRFILVFDGKNNGISSPYSRIDIFFTGKVAADLLIKEKIKGFRGLKELIVVSSDNEVYNYARINACSPMNSEKFVKLALKEKQVKHTIAKKGRVITIIPEQEDSEKPKNVSKREIAEMKKLFGIE